MSWLSKAVRGVGKAVKSVRKSVGLPPLTVRSALTVVPGGSAVSRALDAIRGKAGNVGQAIEEGITAWGDQAASKVATAKQQYAVGSIVTSPMGLLVIGAVLFSLIGSRRR